MEAIEHTFIVEVSLDEVPRFMIELQNDNHLQLTDEHVVHVGLSMEEQSEVHVEPMMEEDVHPSFGLAIDEGQHRDDTLGFQHSLLQRCPDRVYSIISPPLRTRLREVELSRHIRGDD